jgi:hypothetical protein
MTSSLLQSFSRHNAKIIAAISIAATVAYPAAVARADDLYQFQSPSGNISCVLAAFQGAVPHVSCEIVDHTWAPPPKPQFCEGEWGDRIGMDQGSPPRLTCHTDTTRGSGLAILRYGETRSIASITCEGSPVGVTCADMSTDHFFRLSRESHDLQ